MSYLVTKYPQGTFSWADFFSKDIQASKAFFAGLFGWTSEDMPTGEGRPDYTMFYLDGHEVAGGSPPFDPNMPSFWSSYITVDNVDEMAAKVETLGGKVTMPPMDVLDSGRMATIEDPTGANVSLWEAKKHIGAQVVNMPGAMCWNELYTKDVEKAKEFYKQLLGWTYTSDDENGGYTTIHNNGRANGGIIQISPEIGSMPPNWTVYFTVSNMQESVEKVKELGGQVHMEKTLSVGKIAMVTEPGGSAFILMEMSVTPEEWVE